MASQARLMRVHQAGLSMDAWRMVPIADCSPSGSAA